MLVNYLLASLGLILLIGSGKYLVKGSVGLASYFGLSTLVIGVTVVAFGTSTPELLVSVQAALKDHPEISLGNVIGSNISNIAIVLAITAIILPIPVNRNSLFRDWPVMMAVSLIFFLVIQDNFLSRLEGVGFNLMLVAFVYFTLKFSKKNTDKAIKGIEKMNIWLAIGFILISSLGLVFGAGLLVENAVEIASSLHVSERAISITVIAVGTSLPELTTSVMAAIQKETDISVGNIIGSNIFNILSVLGITAIIKPIPVNPVINIDVIWMLLISVLLFVLLMPLKRSRLSRFGGIILLGVYVYYIYTLFSV